MIILFLLYFCYIHIQLQQYFVHTNTGSNSDNTPNQPTNTQVMDADQNAAKALVAIKNNN